uniref:Putative conserved secreted protein n=1 Tax=Ixodes ricinus TaxID=34613 RepID=A0A147BCK8_IXORI
MKRLMVKSMWWAIFGDATAILYQKLMISARAPATNHVMRELIPQIADTANLRFTMRYRRGNSLQTPVSREKIPQVADAADSWFTVRRTRGSPPRTRISRERIPQIADAVEKQIADAAESTSRTQIADKNTGIRFELGNGYRKLRMQQIRIS